MPADIAPILLRPFFRVDVAAAELVGAGVDIDLIRRGALQIQKHDENVLRKWSKIRERLEHVKLGSHRLAPAQYDADGKYIGPNDGISDTEMAALRARLLSES